MKPPKTIYLQTDEESEQYSYEGVTWCVDQINTDDKQYILSTPEREVASDLLKTLKHAAAYFQMLESATGVQHPVLQEIEDAIARATKDSEG